MIGLLLGVLRVAWPYILFAIVAGAIYWKAQTWCNNACGEWKETAEQLQTEKDAAQARATQLALLWADGLNKVEVKYVEVERRVRETFRGIRDRTQDAVAGSSGGIRFSGAAVKLLDDASNAANSAAPQVDNGPPPPLSSPTGETFITPQEFAEKWVEAAEAYADVYAKWQAAIAAYNAIRDGNGPVADGN